MPETVMADIRAYYDREIVRRMTDKYGFEFLDALRLWLDSEAHAMFVDPELEMLEFSPLALFDMWEAERVTGDPRQSLFLRCE